jgi:hypothetical protein
MSIVKIFRHDNHFSTRGPPISFPSPILTPCSRSRARLADQAHSDDQGDDNTGPLVHDSRLRDGAWRRI